MQLILLVMTQETVFGYISLVQCINVTVKRKKEIIAKGERVLSILLFGKSVIFCRMTINVKN